jgi:hypothetical protein
MAAQKARKRRAKPARRSTSPKKPVRRGAAPSSGRRRSSATAGKARKSAKKRVAGRKRPVARTAARRVKRAKAPAARGRKLVKKPAAPRRTKPARTSAARPPATAKTAKASPKPVKAIRSAKAPKAVAPKAVAPRPRRRARMSPASIAELRYPTPPSTLDRKRKLLSDDERLDSPTGDLPDDRTIAMARSGHDELRQELSRYTGASPVLTAGDVDANWQDAYAVGDETPGGDNPTPDQDRVDDIGKALGVSYRTDEELHGGDEITERDRHRWELDPASSDDWPHDPAKKPEPEGT